jgi:hypothetical protein
MADAFVLELAKPVKVKLDSLSFELNQAQVDTLRRNSAV